MYMIRLHGLAPFSRARALETSKHGSLVNVARKVTLRGCLVAREIAPPISSKECHMSQVPKGQFFAFFGGFSGAKKIQTRLEDSGRYVGKHIPYHMNKHKYSECEHKQEKIETRIVEQLNIATCKCVQKYFECSTYTLHNIIQKNMRYSKHSVMPWNVHPQCK